MFLLRAPASWPQPAVAATAMVLLAVLDLTGSLVTKLAVTRHSPALAAAGAALFLLVFWVYASSLQVAELSAVTFGWIVFLQIGVVLVDRFWYGVNLKPGAWLAVVVLVAAQAYLILAMPEPTHQPTSAPVQQSAEDGDQQGHTAGGHVEELGHAERSDGDPRDQQGMAHGLVSRIELPAPAQLIS